MIRFTGGKLVVVRLRSAQADSVEGGGDPIWITRRGRLVGALQRTFVTTAVRAFHPSGIVRYEVKSGALPPTFTLDPLTGRILGTAPDNAFDVEYFFTVEATSATGTTATRPFSIFVIGVNDPPVWVTPENLGTFMEDQDGPVEIGLVATDDDGVESITMIGGSLPPNFNYNVVERRLAGPARPVDSEDASYTFVFRAIDSGGLSADRTFTITLANVNQPPVIRTEALDRFLLDALPGDVVDIQFEAVDDEPISRLVWALDGAVPPGLTFTQDGLLRGNVRTNITLDEQHPFLITVTDRQGASATRAFEIQYSRFNEAPVWITPEGSVGTFFEREGQTIIATLVASDDFSLAGIMIAPETPLLPDGIELSNDGVLAGSMPSVMADTNFTFVARAFDDRDLFADRSFVLTVKAVNEIPVWQISSGEVVAEFANGAVFTHPFPVEDDAPGLIVSIISGSLPPYVSLTADTLGLVASVPPDLTTVAESTLTFRALDVGSLFADRTLLVRVGALVPTPPNLNTWPGTLTGDGVWLLDRRFEGTPGLTYSFAAYNSQGVLADVSLSGTLPPGLGFETPVMFGDLGRIVPEVAGESRTFYFDAIASVQDISVTREYGYIVDGVANITPVWVTPETLTTAIEGESVARLMVASDDEPGVVYTFVDRGNLPASWSLDPSGMLTGSLGAISTNGTYTFEIAATDAVGASVTRTFALPLFNPRNGPEWVTPAGVLATVVGLAAVSEGSIALVAQHAVDYAVVQGSLPAFLTLIGAEGAIVGRMDDVRTATVFPEFVVAATSEVGETTLRTFAIALLPRVNTPPRFTATGIVVTTNVGASINYGLPIADDDIFEPAQGTIISSLPAALTFDPQTQSIVGTIVPFIDVDTRDFSIVAGAVDSDGASTTATLIFRALRIDTPPTWVTPSGAVGTFVPGQTVGVSLVAADDYGPLSYAITDGSLPTGVSLVGNVITGRMPREPVIAQNTFIWSFEGAVSDIRAQEVERSFSLVLRRDNELPVWQTTTLPDFDERAFVLTTLVATDDSGAIADYSVVDGSLPNGVVLSPAGVLSGFAPSIAQDISFTFTARAEDPSGNTSDRVFVLQLRAVNDPPEWVTPGGNLGTFAAFLPVNVTLVAQDVGSVITYSLASGTVPSGLTLTSAGVITGSPSQVASTTETAFVVRARDQTNLFADRGFSLSVSRGNAPPVWTTPTTGTLATFNEQTAISVTFVATDPDALAVNYSLVVSPFVGATLNASSGVLTGTTPDVSTDTSYSFVVRATDAGGASVQNSFFITSRAIPQFTTPAGSLGTLTEGFASSFIIGVAAQPAVISRTLIGTLPPGLTLNAGTGAITGTPSGLSVDTSYPFSIRVTTASGAENTRAFSIFVRAVYNDPNTYMLLRFNGNLEDATGNNTPAIGFSSISYVPGPTAAFETGFTAGRSSVSDRRFVSVPRNIDWNWANDWTMECFARFSDASFMPIASMPRNASESAHRFIRRSTNSISHQILSSPGFTGNEGFTNFAPSNTWLHVAAQQTSGVRRVFVNGIFSDAINTNAFSFPSDQPLWIGNNAESTTYSNLDIDEFRFSRVSRYSVSDTFNTPSGPLSGLSDPVSANVRTLLPLTTATQFADTVGGAGVTSTATIAAGGAWGQGAAAFSTSGGANTISFPPLAEMNMTRDAIGWNIEFWLFLSATPSSRGSLWNARTGAVGAAGSGYYYYVNNTRQIILDLPNPSTSSLNYARVMSPALALNQWHHVVLQQHGLQVACYVNGALGAKSTILSDLTRPAPMTTDAIRIGTSNGTADRWSGFMNDIRFTVGARYPFLPPAAPFTE